MITLSATKPQIHHFAHSCALSGQFLTVYGQSEIEMDEKGAVWLPGNLDGWRSVVDLSGILWPALAPMEEGRRIEAPEIVAEAFANEDWH